MVCKNCQTENPENAVFCMQCGKRIDGNSVCPACGALCPEAAKFCMQCGTRISAESEATETADTAKPIFEEPKEEIAKTTKKGSFEKVKRAFDLSGGIVLMAGVLFALVFTLCMGITVTANITESYQSHAVSETTMLWEYFRSVYENLADNLEAMRSYTTSFAIANYLPVVLTTAVCAGTLVSVFSLTVISLVKYIKHFKNPDYDYAKPAVGAILSFVLGTAAFLTINLAFVSFHEYQLESIQITVSFSRATLAGIILCCIALGVWFGFKTAAIGKGFLKKSTAADFVCTVCGILIIAIVAVFANSPAVDLKFLEERRRANSNLNFFFSNLMISMKISENAPDFTATYVCSVLAQFAQFALLVLAFTLLIKRIGGFGERNKSRLALSIALFSLAVVSLVLSCVAIHFGYELIRNVTGEIIPSIAAGPIVALVFSALALADAITHKVLVKKFVEQAE